MLSPILDYILISAKDPHQNIKLSPGSSYLQPGCDSQLPESPPPWYSVRWGRTKETPEVRCSSWQSLCSSSRQSSAQVACENHPGSLSQTQSPGSQPWIMKSESLGLAFEMPSSWSTVESGVGSCGSMISLSLETSGRARLDLTQELHEPYRVWLEFEDWKGVAPMRGVTIWEGFCAQGD